MATNPMQRRARNSFILGILVATLILGAILGGVGFLFLQKDKENKQLTAATIYVASKEIASGAEISISDLTPVKVSASAKAENAVTPNSFKVEDKDGNITQSKATAKINLKRGTAVTTDMLYIDGDARGADVRKQEYNSIVLPMDLVTGEFIDIRFLLPSGQDFIVVSKKKVEIPQISGIDSTNTIAMEMTEGEILAMSNAIVEAYMIEGSKLYATKYVDAGNQAEATPTYSINQAVRELIMADANIVNEAKNELAKIYGSESAKSLRENRINAALQSQENAEENEKTKMQESITNSQTTREEYLQSLTGGTSTTTP